jgi:competence ComEA-like helix-hairpin-helix protein
MRNFSKLMIGLVSLAACNGGNGQDPVSLEWKQGDSWHLATTYRSVNNMTEEAPVALDGNAADVFEESWSDDVVWSYEVIESNFKPSTDDELYTFAAKKDGSIAKLTVIRAHADASLNDDDQLLESDPVVYLVFRAKRNRLAGIVTFMNIDGERVEQAYSSKELDRSWSSLSQSNLSLAPSYLAPFGFHNEDEERVLENGSTMNTVSVDNRTVDVVFNDELGGGPVATRYEEGGSWPTWTVTDNMESRLMTDDEVAKMRSARPFLSIDPPADYDFRAALRAAIDIDTAFSLTETEIAANGWSESVPTDYQPWNGSWWRQSEGALVFGYNGRKTYSGEIKSDIDPLKTALDKLSKDLRDMEDGEEKQAKVDEYRSKQDELVEKLVDFYGNLLEDFDGGKIAIADGKISHSEDSWSYDLDELSPMDKMALKLYTDGQTSPNPFYMQAWELLNHYSPAGGSWWGHCNGWAGAAILTHEPTESVTSDIDGQSVEFSTADIKGLLTETHYSTYAHFYGSRYYKEGDDVADLSPAAFHKIVSFYIQQQRVPLVFDTTATDEVWNFPFYAADITMNETTTGDNAGVNVNTAPLEVLVTLPGIGDTLGQRIIDYRESYGTFQSIDELAYVYGIGQGTVSGLYDLVRISPAEREFDVSAVIHFATDGVNETHVDNGSPESRGFTKTWGYTLFTDENGLVLRGDWDDDKNHPDFAWVPYNNPTSRATGGSENPYLAYGNLLSVIGEDFIRQ